ncbi:MAG: hypothetical protein KAT58_06190 [candidate division Zixibacteria bacterium]|nr:hypothetical protein [candidate division Zixibacteria bacterium]
MTLVYQPSEPVSPEEKVIGDIMCECHETTGFDPGDCDCKDIGNAKHECCERAIQNKKPANVGGEQGYTNKGKKLSGSKNSYVPAPPKGSCFPDACSLDSAGKPKKFYDFKFVCPKGCFFGFDKNGKLKYSSGRGSPGGDFMIKGGRNSQFNRYKRLGKKLKPPVTEDPRALESSACK